MSAALGILVGVSLALYLRAIYLGPAWEVYVFKPLTTCFIIVRAGLATREARQTPAARYGRLVCAGLLCSLAGDVLLMLPDDRFMAGLGAFLIAHLCYIGAFTTPAGPRATWRIGMPYALVLAALLAFLLPHTGEQRLASACYAAALVGMAWQSAERWHATRGRGSAGAAVGGALFVVSDAALAADRFVAPFGAASLVIMVTYAAAQWLIAASVGPSHAPLPPRSAGDRGRVFESGR